MRTQQTTKTPDDETNVHAVAMALAKGTNLGIFEMSVLHGMLVLHSVIFLLDFSQLEFRFGPMKNFE